MMNTTNIKKLQVLTLVPLLMMSTACASASVTEDAASGNEPAVKETVTEESAAAVTASAAVTAKTEYFTERDLEQTPDLTDAVRYTVSDGQDINISEEGVYVLSGSAKEVTVTVDAVDDAKVQIVLDGVTITNTDSPAVYVKNADKVFVTTLAGTNSTLTVSGTFTADGDENTNAVLYAKDDLVINGEGTLTVNSTKHGINAKDDLKITGGTLVINAEDKGIRANDSVRIAGGTITIDAKDDGIHAENDDDDSVGWIYIAGGEITVSSGDDAVHATSTLVIDGGTLNISGGEGLEATDITINDGDITINASDDGINAGRKSSAYEVAITINGGNIKITMNGFDTDAIDSNGNLTVNGGTIDITGQSAFDYDGKAEYNGGTIIVNGETVNAITNQMMGGMGGMHGNMGDMNGQMPENGEMPEMGEMPSDGGFQGGHHGGMRPGMNENSGFPQPNSSTDTQSDTENKF